MSEPMGAPEAVLFDRDGTLVADVPYNGDPDLVTPMPTVSVSLRVLRRAHIRTGVVSNQSGIARGILTRDQVDRVNKRIDRLLGPFDVWCYCPHSPDDACDCRKPRPGLVLAAASRLGIAPEHVAVIGDIGADVQAAAAAGARGVLVPTPKTLQREVEDAPLVAATVAEALGLLFAKVAS
jgi:HAD superfamily hydrolase (TIGR01662 family)